MTNTQERLSEKVGDIYNDSCLEKIRANVGKCAVCGRPRYHKAPGAWGDETEHDNSEHKFVDAGGEPLFVLRAQDVTAVPTIQDWLKRNPDLPAVKREEALSLIDAILRWPKKKNPD